MLWIYDVSACRAFSSEAVTPPTGIFMDWKICWPSPKLCFERVSEGLEDGLGEFLACFSQIEQLIEFLPLNLDNDFGALCLK